MLVGWLDEEDEVIILVLDVDDVGWDEVLADEVVLICQERLEDEDEFLDFDDVVELYEVLDDKYMVML